MSGMAVIDFETTGMSPDRGDRPTEVAIVRIRDGQVLDHFTQLMNPGVPIPYFISQLTGITQDMVRHAPPVAEVMQAAADFVGDWPLVAHNAAFDRKFWQAELRAIGRDDSQPFVCTVMLARRLYPDAGSHRLSALGDWLSLPRNGQAHRALSDAELTARLLLRMQHDLRSQYGIERADHDFLGHMQRSSRAQLGALLARSRQTA